MFPSATGSLTLGDLGEFSPVSVVILLGGSVEVS